MSYRNLRLTAEQLKNDGLWLSELDALLNTDVTNGVVSILPISVAIRNLQGWVNDNRTYSFKFRNKWGYAITDLQVSLGLVGTNLKNELEPEFSDALSALTSLLPANNRSVVVSYNEPSRLNARLKLQSLESKSAARSSVIASWKDLVNDCKNPNASVSELHYHILLLTDLAELSGLDVDSRGILRTLSNIMTDEAFAIEEARTDLGHRKYPVGDEFEDLLNAKADLSMNDRLDLCDRIMALSDSDTDNVIWLYIQRAALDCPSFDYGAVRFYEGEWLRGNILNNGPQRHKLPPELASENSHVRESDFPEGKDMIFARIDMGKRQRVGAVRSARELLDAIVTLAVFDSKDWKVLSGYLHFVDGRLRQKSGFRSDEKPSHLDDYSARFDHTHSELQHLKTKFTPISNTNPRLSQALETRKWIRDVERADSLTRTLTYVRATERVSSWVNGGGLTWQEFATSYLKEGWAINTFYDEIRDVTYEKLGEIYDYDKNITDQIEPLKIGVIEESGTSYKLHLDKAVAVIPQLEMIYSSLTRKRPITELARKTKDGISVGTELDVQCAIFDRMLNRLVSCRDSAQHGGPLNDASVNSVVDFAGYIAGLASWTAIEAIMKGNDIESDFVRKNTDNIQKHEDLNTGASISRLFI